MIKAIKIDEHQKSLLQGKKYAPDLNFYPVKDKFDNWIISVEEQANCINPTFWWVKDLDTFDTELNNTII